MLSRFFHVCKRFALVVIVLTGLVVATAIRTGYDRYIEYFAAEAKTEADAAKSGVIGNPITLQRIHTTELDADFTPPRTVEVGFDQLRLADGRDFPLQTTVTAGSGQIIRFVAAREGKNEKKGVKDAAAEKTREAKAHDRAF